MRHSKAIVAAGTVRTSALGMRHALLLAAIVAAAIWAGVAFAQEAYIGHKLSQQVADLRKQNTVLAAQNQGYHKDVQAITSGAANEEEARLNGYAKPAGAPVPGHRTAITFADPITNTIAFAFASHPLTSAAGHPARRYTLKTRSGAAAARRAHNPKVVGSNPTSATIWT